MKEIKTDCGHVIQNEYYIGDGAVFCSVNCFIDWKLHIGELEICIIKTEKEAKK
jgi:hypothetical protein